MLYPDWQSNPWPRSIFVLFERDFVREGSIAITKERRLRVWPEWATRSYVLRAQHGGHGCCGWSDGAWVTMQCK